MDQQWYKAAVVAGDGEGEVQSPGILRDRGTGLLVVRGNARRALPADHLLELGLVLTQVVQQTGEAGRLGKGGVGGSGAAREAARTVGDGQQVVT